MIDRFYHAILSGAIAAFHVATTYNILRHNGVEIGKRDYLGNP